MAFWRLRTLSMFAYMTLLLMAVGALVSWLFRFNMMVGFGIMFGLSLFLCAFSYFNSKKAALKANHARIISEYEEPRLYSTVRKVANLANVPMPEVGIVESSVPNAFATGRNPSDAAVVATRGLLNLLTDEELEGVIAHEMAHVKNRDILVMSVASMMASMIAFVTRLAVWSAIFSDDENGGISFALAILADITLPFAAILIQLGVSRSREYLADESGARLTGRPMALASALNKLETGCTFKQNTYDSPSTAHVWISDPYGKKKRSFLKNLFTTHPSTADRIERLKKLDFEINGKTHY